MGDSRMTKKWKHSDGDDYLELHITTDTQTAIDRATAYRWLHVSLSDTTILNDGSDSVTVTIEVIDGFEIATGTNRSNATVLPFDGDVYVEVDGAETTKTLSGGSLSFDVTTTKDSGSTIDIQATNLASVEAESHSATIEVTS